MQPTRSLLAVALIVALGGCATPDYSQRDSNAQVIGDNVVRYGSIGAAGTGGYFAGQALGGHSVVAGVGGAAAGAGIMYALNKFVDSLRGRAYKNGKLDGAAAARAEILHDQWEREAVYGIHDDDKAKVSTTRRVYVPARTVNGVQMAGGYQEVQVVYP